MTNNNPHFLHKGEDGLQRCYWAGDDKLYQDYHDHEWGRPVVDDFRLFEKICLEGFQSGLSWLTILRKRENFRAAFAGFDFYQLALFDDKNIAELMRNKGIVRHRGKISAAINNAQRALEIVQEFDSLAAYIWAWQPPTREADSGKNPRADGLVSITPTSQALSKDLKRRGWQFVGPTTAYAFMQAMGLVNDHMPGCFCCTVVADSSAKIPRRR